MNNAASTNGDMHRRGGARARSLSNLTSLHRLSCFDCDLPLGSSRKHYAVLFNHRDCDTDLNPASPSRVATWVDYRSGVGAIMDDELNAKARWLKVAIRLLEFRHAVQ